ncbi:MAG TPA: helix-turn-helix domain-containing protein [Gammaproteobacteria bacterium]|nr:helix-turn-helix domain-containing protein [Gammaproteobacteria bacterium]
MDCEDCGLDPICMVLDYAEEASGVPEGVLLRRRPVERGEIIFRQDDPFRSLFAVKSGSFKTSMENGGQSKRVIGFQFPGELIGVEAMSRGKYPCTARALQNGSVCELHIARLPESGRPLEALQAAVIELLGKEVAFNHQLVSSLVHQSAEQRICGFILSLSSRLAHRRLPSLEFTFTMSRTDIGNYLGLASETVSRVLTRMGRSGAIHLQRKRIRILDRNALEQCADG